MGATSEGFYFITSHSIGIFVYSYFNLFVIRRKAVICHRRKGKMSPSYCKLFLFTLTVVVVCLVDKHTCMRYLGGGSSGGGASGGGSRRPSYNMPSSPSNSFNRQITQQE